MHVFCLEGGPPVFWDVLAAGLLSITDIEKFFYPFLANHLLL